LKNNFQIPAAHQPQLFATEVEEIGPLICPQWIQCR